MYIYLDDERKPKTDKDWIIVRSYNECVSAIENDFRKIKEISFDHDLGEEKTGFDCLKYIVELDINLNGRLLHKDFKYNFHTANPVGRDNMDSYIKSYLKNKEEKHVCDT